MPEVRDIQVRRDDNGNIWSWIRNKWLVETPEETVRQAYLPVLVYEYGYAVGQMSEELELTGRGSGHARADFVIWRAAQDKIDGRSPLMVVECKSDNVTIRPEDYWQGDNYARMTGARFLITHNTRETRYWRVLHDKMPKSLEEIENVPTANASDAEIENLMKALKVFREDEFADLLHQCHNVIRNREKKDPAAAFDEIAKILFIKVWVERELRKKRRRENLFTVEYLDAQLGDNPIEVLFQQTKDAYRDDQIFASDAKIDLKAATAREIVKRLERYNLSDTSEDIKGIAFERFLGRTFRGEIGQFFTPRSVVEFMLRMIAPTEGEVVCDPASGSGGFLIRFFEDVREQIHADVDQKYRAYRASLEGQGLGEEELAAKLRSRYEELQEELDPSRRGSRTWNLANRTIYGTDANDRMARTSKMNMIMHGDGHGGVHHHDGFLNVNGIFEGRFDIILTNPPFGQNVEPGDVVEPEAVEVPRELHERYIKEYGATYQQAIDRVKAHLGQPIASLFTLPKKPDSKVKTEILFIERCLDLLKPGGRMAIVMPEGVLNNPSLEYVRTFVERRAWINAVVSLPDGTFRSAKASVKASLLFLTKFTDEDTTRVQAAHAAAEEEANRRIKEESDRLAEPLTQAWEAAKASGDKARAKATKKALDDEVKRARKGHHALAEAIFREAIDYPVFMYDAQRVGITPTGAPDQNELYPNDSVPEHIDETALELYQRFLQDPESFYLAENE